MVGITTIGSAVAGNIIKLTAAGKSTFYELPDNWVPEGLTAGPDGNLWFTAWLGANSDAAVAIGKITPAGAVTIFPLPEPGTGPATITSGPEHNLWFTEAPVDRIGRVGTRRQSARIPAAAQRYLARANRGRPRWQRVVHGKFQQPVRANDTRRDRSPNSLCR